MMEDDLEKMARFESFRTLTCSPVEMTRKAAIKEKMIYEIISGLLTVFHKYLTPKAVYINIDVR